MGKFSVLSMATGYVSYTKFNQALISSYIRPGDIVIDATCGKGFDSLFLAKSSLLTSSSGKLYCMDIQQEAIEHTKRRLELNGFTNIDYCDRISYICQSHETFPNMITPNSMSCIMYNLGYLPNPKKVLNKALITTAETTLNSLKQATKLIKPGGIISIMAYRGHPGGEEEAQAVLTYLESLPDGWRLVRHESATSKVAPLILLATNTATS